MVLKEELRFATAKWADRVVEALALILAAADCGDAGFAKGCFKNIHRWASEEMQPDAPTLTILAP